MRNSIIIAFAVTLVVFVGLQSQPASAETYHFSLDGNDIKNAFGRFMNGGKSEKSKKNRKNNHRNSSKYRGKQASSRHRNVNQPAYVPQKAEKIPASWKVEEKTVGPAPDAGNIYWLSPKGMHLAAVHMEGSRFVVSIDSVAGEKFNEILHAAVGVGVEYDANGMVRRAREKWRGPVAFSPDGSRYAYAARQGKEAVVILDGKEIFRDVYKKAIPPLIRDSVSMLSFTPDGKHLFFYAGTGRLMMDGQPVTPKLKGMPWPFFSADGSRWGLLAEPFRPFNAWNNYADGSAFMALVKKYIKQSDEAHREAIYIDGKEVAYNCQHPRFTLDGKHVVCTQDSNGKQSLLVDGAPLMTVNRIERLVLSPNGGIAVIDGKHRLYIDGKAVPGGENVWNMTFSPDGKRWAAVVRSNPEVWVVVDGKKQLEYDNISNVAFTPDSSKLVYIAESGKKKFVVVNGEEDHGADSISFGPIFGKIGNHVTYQVNDLHAPDRWKHLKVYHDGKEHPYRRSVEEIVISPDGAHYAYFANGLFTPFKLIIDGEVKGGAAQFMHMGKIYFSPDSQHVAALSWGPKGKSRKELIYRDGKFVSLPRGVNYIKVLGFTSDSKHLLIKGDDNTGNVYFLDGKRVANFHLKISSGIGGFPRLKSWEMQPDGSVVLIGHMPVDHNNSGVVKRIKILPERQSKNLLAKKGEI